MRHATLLSLVTLCFLGFLFAMPLQAVSTTHRMLMLGGGIQEVPPTPSAAFTAGVFDIDTVANTCTYKIVVSDLPSGETMAHIHGPADPGANGGVQHALPLGKVKDGTWNYPESVEADLLAGKMYVNVHSVATNKFSTLSEK